MSKRHLHPTHAKTAIYIAFAVAAGQMLVFIYFNRLCLFEIISMFHSLSTLVPELRINTLSEFSIFFLLNENANLNYNPKIISVIRHQYRIVAENDDSRSCSVTHDDPCDPSEL